MAILDEVQRGEIEKLFNKRTVNKSSDGLIRSSNLTHIDRKMISENIDEKIAAGKPVIRVMNNSEISSIPGLSSTVEPSKVVRKSDKSIVAKVVTAKSTPDGSIVATEPAEIPVEELQSFSKDLLRVIRQSIPVSILREVNDKLYGAMKIHKLNYLGEVAMSSIPNLTEVSGIGEKTANKLRDKCQVLINCDRLDKSLHPNEIKELILIRDQLEYQKIDQNTSDITKPASSPPEEIISDNVIDNVIDNVVDGNDDGTIDPMKLPVTLLNIKKTQLDYLIAAKYNTIGDIDSLGDQAFPKLVEVKSIGPATANSILADIVDLLNEDTYTLLELLIAKNISTEDNPDHSINSHNSVSELSVRDINQIIDHNILSAVEEVRAEQAAAARDKSMKRSQIKVSRSEKKESVVASKVEPDPSTVFVEESNNIPVLAIEQVKDSIIEQVKDSIDQSIEPVIEPTRDDIEEPVESAKEPIVVDHSLETDIDALIRLSEESITPIEFLGDGDIKIEIQQLDEILDILKNIDLTISHERYYEILINQIIFGIICSVQTNMNASDAIEQMNIVGSQTGVNTTIFTQNFYTTDSMYQGADDEAKLGIMQAVNRQKIDNLRAFMYNREFVELMRKNLDGSDRLRSNPSRATA